MPPARINKSNAKTKLDRPPRFGRDDAHMNATRWLIPLLAAVTLVLVPACAKTKQPAAASPKFKGATTGAAAPGKKDDKVIVTPAPPMVGRVASVHVAGQFVILSFQAGPMPVPEQRLGIYRGGLKVGEVKISKEQIGANQAADIVAGEAQPGDEARPE
jgi:hypothetical protein